MSAPEPGISAQWGGQCPRCDEPIIANTFDPCDYTALEAADNYTKRTCLWAGGGFVMPPVQRDLTLGPPDDRIHKAPPSAQRANFRSATPMGFARAVFEANRPAMEAAA